jgi:hypothetical protein
MDKYVGCGDGKIEGYGFLADKERRRRLKER